MVAKQLQNINLDLPSSTLIILPSESLVSDLGIKNHKKCHFFKKNTTRVGSVNLKFQPTREPMSQPLYVKFGQKVLNLKIYHKRKQKMYI